MAYGLKVWDQNGNVQFNTDDPPLFIDNGANYSGTVLIGTVTTDAMSIQSSYDGDNRRQSISSSILTRPTTELIAARPSDASGNVVSGSIGWTTFNDNNWWYTSSTSLTFDNSPNPDISMAGCSYINWYKVRTSADLTAPTTGYGLTVWNSAGDVTFTSDPAGTGVSFAAWASIVAFKGRGDSYGGGSDPRGELLYTAANSTEFDQVYVILNDHNYRLNYLTGADAEIDPPSGHDHEINLVNRSYYFDATNFKVYGAAYTTNQTFSYATTNQFGQVKWTKPTGASTYPSNYVVLRAFQG